MKRHCIPSLASAIAIICLAITPSAAESAPTLEPLMAQPFRDNGVLQQKIQLPVWGTSLPGAKVTVSFDGKTASSTADAEGRWHWADGKIDDSQLVVSAKGVANPIAVRYAYTSQPHGHLLYKTDGMPIGPFTTCGYDEIRQTQGK